MTNWNQRTETRSRLELSQMIGPSPVRATTEHIYAAGENGKRLPALQPSYQREYVWKLKPELRPRLVESLLLEIPIPPLYFGRVSEGTLEVIDGQQRLRTLIDFVSNQFALTRLHA